MRKILVLGGIGAMGVFLVEILTQSKENLVYVTSRSSHESKNDLKYIQGNARDEKFIRNVLSEKYDVIIDFMNYDYDEYVSRHRILMAATSHYLGGGGICHLFT